jgi:RNA polymerase sigma-70 factor (ECF subfamily)
MSGGAGRAGRAAVCPFVYVAGWLSAKIPDAQTSSTCRGDAGRAMSSRQPITRLLKEWGEGEEAALERLLPLVEQELRAIAGRYMRDERANHTLQTTALINEAYLRLARQKQVSWKSREHFYGLAAILMRRVLLDYARAQQRRKRGGGCRVSLSEASLLSEQESAEIIALNEALEKLERLDERKSRIVELRYFSGLGVKEIAEVLKVAPSTVSREWAFARAWLKDEMSRGS